MKNLWFEDWFDSHYYHMLYRHRDDKEAEQFIDRLIKHLNPDKKSIMLDVACGNGRHAFQLAQKGFEVTGFDLSEQNIQQAAGMENNLLHFYKHDMRLPFWINYFDYAFNFFTSFGYFDSERDHVKAIRTIAQSLKKKGILVIDYLNAIKAINQIEQKENVKTIDNVRFTTRKWHDDKFIYKKIIIEDKNLPQPLVYTEKVSGFKLKDFMHLFSGQSLHIIETFGDYSLSPFNEDESPRLIMIAEKK
ncbi:MAG: methyltransferase domain-containing protein [Ferruginibacter sp.]|nr:methyltransferase domain-containing protein [Ferruginibacter sp.]